MNLICNLDSRVNIHQVKVKSHTLRWIKSFGLPKYLGETNLWKLAVMAYPKMPYDQICIAADLVIWLFYFDDLQEKGEIDIDKFSLSIENICNGKKDNSTRMLNSFENVFERIKHSGQPLDTFIFHIKEYMIGCKLECTLKSKKAIPTLNEYLYLRPMVSAVFPCLDLISVLRNIRKKACPIISVLEKMTNNHISWANDILGLDRDLKNDHCSNLVIVLAQEDSISIREAKEKAIKLCNQELEAFLRLEEESKLSQDYYVQGLKHWIQGNFDWTLETNRYS